MYFYEVTMTDTCRRHQPDVLTYNYHKVICETFQHKKGIRDVLYVVKEKNIYVVSPHEPLDLYSNLSIRSKPYDPSFEKGTPLAFDVRISDQERVGKKRLPFEITYKERNGIKDTRLDFIMYKAAEHWFQKKSKKYGFQVRNFLINGYHHYDFKKTDGTPVKFTSIDIRGVLEVTSPAVFVHALHTGIGRCKSYGCGLMLVSR